MPLSPMYPPQERREEAPPSDVKRELFYGIVWLGFAALDRFKGHGVGIAMVLSVGAFVSAFGYGVGMRPRNRILAVLSWYAIAVAVWLATRRG